MTDNLTWPTFKVPQAAIEAARKAIVALREKAKEQNTLVSNGAVAEAALQAAAPFMRSAEEYEFLADEVIRLHLKIEQMEALGTFADGIEAAAKWVEKLTDSDRNWLAMKIRALADRKPEVKK